MQDPVAQVVTLGSCHANRHVPASFLFQSIVALLFLVSCVLKRGTHPRNEQKAEWQQDGEERSQVERGAQAALLWPLHMKIRKMKPPGQDRPQQ